MSNFGIIGNEFINLYTKENPILEIGDVCYCLITNMVDFHRPLIIKANIVEDKFTDGMNKVYYVRCLEFGESPNILNEFLIGKSFIVYPHNGEVLQNKKMVQVFADFDMTSNLFKVDAFFVRQSLDKIIELRKEYISIIKKDIVKQLSDIEAI